MSKFTYEKSCEILGVPIDATLEEIKKQWKMLNKKYHTDLNLDVDSSVIKEINGAWDYIKNNYDSFYEKCSSQTTSQKDDSHKEFYDDIDKENIKLTAQELGGCLVFLGIIVLIVVFIIYLRRAELFFMIEKYFDRIKENINQFLETFQ